MKTAKTFASVFAFVCASLAAVTAFVWTGTCVTSWAASFGIPETPAALLYFSLGVSALVTAGAHALGPATFEPSHPF